MLKSVEGTYRDGQIQLAEVPTDTPEESRVIVTFLDATHIDLQERGISSEQAAELRSRLSTFAEDWDSEEMSIYDSYDRNNA